MPLDIALGIFISLGVAHFFTIHASPVLVLFGIICALLPDIDNTIPPLRRAAHDHRNFWHWPLLYIPFWMLFYLLDPLLGIVFFFGTLWHFVHDTFGIGWGIAWLAPLSRRKFLIPESGRRRAYGSFMTWLPDEEAEMAQKWHDPHWLTTWYLRPNLLAAVEYTALFISFVLLAVYYGAS